MIMIDLRQSGKGEKQGVVRGMVCYFPCKKDGGLLYMLVHASILFDKGA